MPKLTSRQIIERENKRALDMDTRSLNTGWGRRHVDAFTKGIGASEIGGSIARIVAELGKYADKHFARFDSTIGTDGVLGEGWSQIAQGALTLLNGELGALDAGTLDGIIREIMLSNNVDPDTGDLFYRVEENETTK